MIRSTENPKHKLVIKFLYETGLRASELLSLKKEVLRKDKETYRFPFHGRGNKTRIVHADKSLVEDVLFEFDVKKGFLFTSRERTSEPMTRQNLYSIYIYMR
jgi:integrase